MKSTHSLTRRIVFAMLAGILLGSALNHYGPPAWAQLYLLDGILGVVGTLFVSALKMMAVPLVFVSLVAGVTALSDLKALGRIGAKALVLYLATTAIAVTIALMLAGVTGPGHGFDAGKGNAGFSTKEAPPLTQMLADIVPTNPVAAMAEGNMLQVIVFALLFGVAVMQGVATVFIANVYGVDLSATDYLLVVLTATLASVGTAAIPAVGLVTLTMVPGQVGLPVEGIALIIGVDRLLDMMRTTVNVAGDCAVSCIVAQSEKALDRTVFDDPAAGSVEAATRHPLSSHPAS